MDLVGAAADERRAQLEAEIGTLYTNISNYRGKISYYNDLIKKADGEYESLVDFKASVQRNQESFSDVNQTKSAALDRVNAVSRNSIVAKRYHDGMKKVLSETGSKITKELYSYLFTKIANEQRSLRNRSDEYYGQVDKYTRAIAVAQRQIAEKTQELQSLA